MSDDDEGHYRTLWPRWIERLMEIIDALNPARVSQLRQAAVRSVINVDQEAAHRHGILRMDPYTTEPAGDLKPCGPPTRVMERLRVAEQFFYGETAKVADPPLRKPPKWPQTVP